MTRPFASSCGGALLAIMLAAPSLAQDNTIQTIANGTVTNGGTSYNFPATTGTNNFLIITNSGSLIDTYGTIGNGLGADFNTVLVRDAGSIWTNLGYLEVAFSGAGNQLIITNGGQVYTLGSGGGGGVYIGNLISSSNNSVVVTGSGSFLTNRSVFYMGTQGGSDNSLTIADGAKVWNADAIIGYGLFVNNNPSNNTVLVTGPGSLWNNNGSITIGNKGWGNQLVVSNNAQVIASSSIVVGSAGASTRLTIANGGQLFANSGTIGSGSSTMNNTVVVTGAGSVWSNASTLMIGNSGSSNSLTISAGAQVFNTSGTIGAFGSDNAVLVTGAGSRWTNSSTLVIGQNGSGNSLTLSNGAQVFNASITVGQSASGNSLTIASGSQVFNGGIGIVGSTGGTNTALVTGAGSLWANASYLSLGDGGGASNRMTISDGAQVRNTDGYIGSGVSPNSLMVVTGAGSIWTNSGFLIVGNNGANSTMIISDGGQVFNTTASLGDYVSGTGSNNAVLVTGAGSLWNSSSTLTVGKFGGGNIVVIANDGQAAATGVTVGSASGNNQLLVTNRGLVEANTLVAGSTAGNSISNRQGIYQFTSPSPIVTPSVAGSIVLTNGTISYRDVTAADINNTEIDEIVRQGDNTFRLNHSSNTLVSTYTFDSAANTGNPMIYQTLSLTNGSRWRTTTLRIASGGVLKGAGTVEATVVTNAGTITAGFSPGVLEFTGNLHLEGTSFVLTELGGTGGGDYDQVNVAGNLVFDGTLTVSLINAFSPADGNSFDIFDFATSSGTFSTLSLPSLGGGLLWDTSQLYTLGTISVTAVPEPATVALIALGGVLAKFAVRGGKTKIQS